MRPSRPSALRTSQTVSRVSWRSALVLVWKAKRLAAPSLRSEMKTTSSPIQIGLLSVALTCGICSQVLPLESRIQIGGVVPPRLWRQPLGPE